MSFELGEQIQELNLNQPFNLPISQKSKDRAYLCWRNEKMIECKMIGPETKCFCNHRLKQHEYLNPKGKKVGCSAMKCKCKCFDYIPTHGAYDFKCLCKHSFKEHDCSTRKCQKTNCKNCNGFMSAWTCSCGSKFIDHETVIQNYEERKAKGKSTSDMARINEQLNSLIDQGSLYKPIKQDYQARPKNKHFTNPYLEKTKIESQDGQIDDEIEEVVFQKK